MTSFLALRASVCAYLWCLIPPVCYVLLYRFRTAIFPLTRSDSVLDTFPQGQAEGRQFETCLTLIFVSHLSGLSFA